MGTRRHTERAGRAPRVAQVDAVDISSEMVRIANGKAEQAGIDNVTFHHAPISGLPPFDRESFDVVCAFNILHLVQDRRVTLAKLFELLRPGGHFVSTTPCLGESWVPFKLILPVMKVIGQAPPVEVFDIAQLEASIQETGFVDMKRPKVSRDKTTAFVLAQKPAASPAS